MKTREEEIKQAAIKEYGGLAIKHFAFEKGAQWADENPKNPWRCSDNVSPENDECKIGEFYIVRFNDVVCIAEYAGFGRWKINNNDNYVTENRFTKVHWMPIPEMEGGEK